MPSSVLVVDDKEMMRDSVGSTLSRAGFTVRTASQGREALKEIAHKRPDVVVTDLNMPGMSGVDLAAEIREVDSDLPVVLMTAFGTVETAVQAMKNGAFDYLTKPFEGDELIISVKRALTHATLLKENAILKANAAPGSDATGLDRLVGESDAMRKVREQVRAVASSHGTVLITGESGVGKEVVARCVHDMSPRRENPFLGVNCAALNESLLESELFGHERGSFTGADKLRKGRFELADSGTLLLDEVSEVSLQIQSKLLRVLQERAFERVGSSTTIGTDVRVVATSNRDLPRSASLGEFRQDLFFRLNVLPVQVPALRERREDVGLLASHFISGICERDGRAPIGMSPDAVELLENYDWPGNVRELQNICERAVVLSPKGADAIGREMLEPWLLRSAPIQKATPLRPAAIGSATPSDASAPSSVSAMGTSFIETKMERPGDRTLADLERETIVATLERFGGHRQRTAKALGIGVRTLGLKLKKWKEERLVAETL